MSKISVSIKINFRQAKIGKSTVSRSKFCNNTELAGEEE
jgi:hypothetical protein